MCCGYELLLIVCVSAAVEPYYVDGANCNYGHVVTAHIKTFDTREQCAAEKSFIWKMNGPVNLECQTIDK